MSQPRNLEFTRKYESQTRYIRSPAPRHQTLPKIWVQVTEGVRIPLEQSLSRGAESKTFSTLPKTAGGWGEGVASLGRQTNQSHSDQAGVLCARCGSWSSNEDHLGANHRPAVSPDEAERAARPQIRSARVRVSAEQPGGVIWP